MAIGDKWRKWEASSERFQVIRQRHPRIISAEQQAAKAERGARLAKLKADRLDRIQARFDRQAAIVAKREAEREAARAVREAPAGPLPLGVATATKSCRLWCSSLPATPALTVPRR
jgi:hypothetical protein